jgi:hypothetical protein
MAYIEAVHKAITAQDTSPAPGVGECVLAAILDDPVLSDYVRAWAKSREEGALDGTPEPPPPPPIDAAYERVRELLRRCGDTAQMASSFS